MSIKELQLEQQPLEVKQLHARFLQLEQELIRQTPELPIALAEIHKQVQQHEELIHLLGDDDLALLHKNFEQFKQVVVFSKASKAATSKRKKLSDKDLDAI